MTGAADCGRSISWVGGYWAVFGVIFATVSGSTAVAQGQADGFTGLVMGPMVIGIG
jgi:hypothetical protein